MKKVLKIAAWLLGGVVVLVAAAVAFIHFKGIPRYEAKPQPLTIEYTPERVAKGELLVNMVCADCHRSQGNRLEGRHLVDIPKLFGDIWSANITKHPELGLGRYSDSELVYLLRTGIRRDGQYIPPYMPKFPHMADEDMYSIIAYLRSDAPIVQASDYQPPKTKPSLFTKFLSNIAFKPLPYPEGPIVAPDTSDLVAYGKYVSTAMVECYSCHSADFTKQDPMYPETSLGYFGGGNKLMSTDGQVKYSANLTMDKETGLGNWTLEDFAMAVRTGNRSSGGPLSDAMPRFTSFSDLEVKAIWTYLQTVPVISNPEVKALRTAAD